MTNVRTLNTHTLTITHDEKAPNPNARCFLAIGPHCWGRATTCEKAIANARRCKPSFVKKPVKWVVFYCHPSTYIDDMGTLCWFEQDTYGKPERVKG